MKKLLSAFLAFALLLSFVTPAFAYQGAKTADTAAQAEKAHDPAICTDCPVVIVRGMDMMGLYIDKGTENERNAFEFDLGDLLSMLYKGISGAVKAKDIDPFFQAVIDYAANLLDGYAMKENGESKYNVSVAKYPGSAENYPEIWENFDSNSERGMTRACAENLPANHTYLFTYDWRLDPYKVADDIAATVDRAIAESGHDKGSIFCASMGGIMTVAYLTKYGYSKVDRCVFMSSTFCGAQVASDVLTGKIELKADTMYNYFSGLLADATGSNAAVAAFMKTLNSVGAFKLLQKVTDYIVDNYKDEVYERVLIPDFAYMPVLWGLVQPQDYNNAVDFVFGDSAAEHKDFLAYGERLQKMMANRTALIENMIRDGVKVAIISHYDKPMAPLYESADFTGDGVLETYEMSGYATVAKYGETLGDDYVPAKAEYLSPDRCVDLSTALFPKYTYIIKGAPHVSASYGTDYSNFFLWLATCDGDFYAGVNEDYPQFMLSGTDQHLSKWAS